MGGCPSHDGGGVPPTDGGGVPPTDGGGVPPTDAGGVPPTDQPGDGGEPVAWGTSAQNSGAVSDARPRPESIGRWSESSVGLLNPTPPTVEIETTGCTVCGWAGREGDRKHKVLLPPVPPPSGFIRHTVPTRSHAIRRQSPHTSSFSHTHTHTHTHTPTPPTSAPPSTDLPCTTAQLH
ncbi:hypothetical protein NHX12_026139 [Muraenolepis orangiensis]|uniref:Uncharacterized protein n=1 Tax=Muraenolepis orangiensis TaxID=630683 RepID=A0A9Q0EJ98_9TELE|nr:hypothetical protein NHX12_026139 [Muraenolepis orangiensis]